MLAGRGSKRMSRSTRAGLQFAVSRTHRQMRKMTPKQKIGKAAPVYLAGVLEYLSAEVLELAGNAAKDNKRARINPRHILLAVSNDVELNNLLKGVTIPDGGIVPHINPMLMPTKAKHTPSHVPTPVKSKSKPKLKLKSVKQSTFAPKKPSIPSDELVTKKKGTQGPINILSEKKLPGGQSLKVIQGNIAHVSCDAVVHPCSSSLAMSGQVGNALRTSGGSPLETEVNSHVGSLAIGTAVMTGAGNLPCGNVIHVHGPAWGGTDPLPLLDKSVKSCLSLADNNSLKSIAFPSISSGGNNFPKQTAAQCILQSIRGFFAGVGGTCSVREIVFVLFDQESINVYTSELARMDV